MRQQLLLLNGYSIKLQEQRFAFYCWIIEKQLKNESLFNLITDKEHPNKDTRFKRTSEFWVEKNISIKLLIE